MILEIRIISDDMELHCLLLFFIFVQLKGYNIQLYIFMKFYLICSSKGIYIYFGNLHTDIAQTC